MATAILAGGSGLVGGCVLRELLADPAFTRVVAVGRRRLGVEHPKLVQVIAEFDALDQLDRPLQGDVAFCCLGTTIKRAGSPAAFRAVDHGAVVAFAWAVQRGGVRSFFTVSALGANAGSRVFYNRVKGETEEALRVLGFARLAVFRPGLLRGPRAEFRLGERIGAVVLGAVEPLLRGRWRKYRAISAATVARAMVRGAIDRQFAPTVPIESDQIAELGR